MGGGAPERGGFGRREGWTHELGLLRHLNALLELVVEVVGQAERIALIRLEQALLAFLDMHQVDGHIQFQQILLQRFVIMARLLQEDKHLLQGHVGSQAIREGAESLTTILELQDWTALEAPIPRQERRRNKPSDVRQFADIDAHIDGLVQWSLGSGVFQGVRRRSSRHLDLPSGAREQAPMLPFTPPPSPPAPDDLTQRTREWRGQSL